MTDLPFIQSFSINKYKEIQHLELEPQIINKCRELAVLGQYFIHVAGRICKRDIWTEPEWSFAIEHFDLLKFDKDGRVHGKQLLVNRLIKTHYDMSGLLNIKYGKLIGFQRRIMWKRIKGQRTILLSQHHCWSRLDKKDEQVINKVYWSWDLLED